MSLNDLSLRPGDLGRREEALAASAEATGIHRELTARWPDVYHYELEQPLQVAAWLENGEDLSDAYSRESKRHNGPLSLPPAIAFVPLAGAIMCTT